MSRSTAHPRPTLLPVRMYLGWSSITPLENLNSGFRLYEVDTGDFNVYEAYTFYSNVVQRRILVPPCCRSVCISGGVFDLKGRTCVLQSRVGHGEGRGTCQSAQHLPGEAKCQEPQLHYYRVPKGQHIADLGLLARGSSAAGALDTSLPLVGVVQTDKFQG
jgi:hypothetical protein